MFSHRKWGSQRCCTNVIYARVHGWEWKVKAVWIFVQSCIACEYWIHDYIANISQLITFKLSQVWRKTFDSPEIVCLGESISTLCRHYLLHPLPPPPRSHTHFFQFNLPASRYDAYRHSHHIMYICSLSFSKWIPWVERQSSCDTCVTYSTKFVYINGPSQRFMMMPCVDFGIESKCLLCIAIWPI